MILIFGGSYQGKLDYAVKRFGLSDGDIFFCNQDDAGIPAVKKAVYEFDKWILALLKSGLDAPCAVDAFIKNNPNAIVISNDISCGVVPLDPFMRQWREALGRALNRISAESGEVVRLFCGIPEILKQ